MVIGWDGRSTDGEHDMPGSGCGLLYQDLVIRYLESFDKAQDER